MKLKIFDIDEFCKDLPEVTYHDIKENSKISKNGLFSQQIFGPIKSYRCACPRSYYRGPNSGETKCEVCGVDITTSEQRSMRYAKITLPFPVLNPIMYYYLIKAKPKFRKILDDIIYFKLKYFIFTDDEGVWHINLLTDDIVIEDYNDFELLEGLDGVVRYFEFLYEKFDDNPVLQFINENKHMIKLHNILVNPPAFRNFSINESGKYILNNLNKFYSELIRRINTIKKLPFNVCENTKLYRLYFGIVQRCVFNISNYILIDKLGKKRGLIRGNILGKRVDFSGRGVIVSDPELSLKNCSIPYKMALEIYKPLFTVYLVKKKIFKKYNDATSGIDDSLMSGDFRFFDDLNEFVKNRVVIINRQPSLHRMSMYAFNPRINKESVIKIHPLICGPLNADFDGDQMAVYAFFDKDVSNEVIKKIGVESNILSPANGSNVLIPSKEIILGVYNATK